MEGHDMVNPITASASEYCHNVWYKKN